MPPDAAAPSIAYFSMEIGLESGMPTYSGGLGVLSGDTLRAAADLRVPMVGVSLAHRKGYFAQHLDAAGQQAEAAADWQPEATLTPANPVVTVTVEGRPVRVRAWRYVVRGLDGHEVPVYLLDTALPENHAWDRTLTDHLYGGDRRYRLAQEIVLGFGGVALLQALGYDRAHYHMNEGHSALLTLALLEQQTQGRGLAQASDEDLEAVRARCIFTTHTPVPAGHDEFPKDVASQLLGPELVRTLEARGWLVNERLHMTLLALYFSRYVNGVAMRHGAVSQDMFPEHTIRAITNGVHSATWTSPAFQALYDQHMPEWRHDNHYLRYAMGLPLHEIDKAHAQAKRELCQEVERRTGTRLDETLLTLGFARRATPYKRADLIFHDPERLRAIARYAGGLQILYAGKAHPSDEPGKAMIRRIFEAAAALGESPRVLYLEGYDMALARQLCAGVDVWLNTPRRPQEASGTSGMKAALNGVPSFSILDGWWVEGHIEGVTGWSIGHGQEPSGDDSGEIGDLYDKLERVIVPLFYGQPARFTEIMRSTIALNGAFFNTQRMMRQYLMNAYFPATSCPAPNGALDRAAAPTGAPPA
jgi:starch phosphorylase